MSASVTPLKIARPLPGEDPLSAATRRLANQSRADSTNDAYRRDWALFEHWCLVEERRCLPADPIAVAEFLRNQHDAGFAPSTIARRLCAIRHSHIAQHQPSPHADHLVSEVMKGIRRTQQHQPVQATPAISVHVKTMVDQLNVATHGGRRDRALLLLGFAAALRRSEIVAIDVEDLHFNMDGLRLHVRRSKSDQEGSGVRIPVPREPRSRYCPVSAVEAWLGKSGIASGAVFRRMYRGDSLSTHRLTCKAVVLRIKVLAEEIGLDPAGFSGHSLRRGFLTSAAAEKKDLRRMADQARHQKLDTTRVYIDEANEFDDHPAKGLLSET